MIMEIMTEEALYKQFVSKLVEDLPNGWWITGTSATATNHGVDTSVSLASFDDKHLKLNFLLTWDTVLDETVWNMLASLPA